MLSIINLALFKSPGLLKMIGYTSFLFITTWIVGCGYHQEANPKPHAYPRIDFPSKSYKSYFNPECNFSFEYPDYASIVKRSSPLEEEAEHPCWFDMVVPPLNSTIHCSYYAISENNRLDSLIFDSFELVGKHNIKAQYIEEIPLKLHHGGGGMLFRIKGPVASPTQFFVTDSTDHFFRGSLYFYNKVQVDSMRVVYEFIDEDIDHMISTFQWN